MNNSVLPASLYNSLPCWKSKPVKMQ